MPRLNIVPRTKSVGFKDKYGVEYAIVTDPVLLTRVKASQGDVWLRMGDRRWFKLEKLDRKTGEAEIREFWWEADPYTTDKPARWL